jgi:hypothetical protein
LNPTLKNQWYADVWDENENKRPWIKTATDVIKELWIDEYKGKFAAGIATFNYVFRTTPLKEKAFIFIRNYKRFKLRYQSEFTAEAAIFFIDYYNEFITTDVIVFNEDKEFNFI